MQEKNLSFYENLNIDFVTNSGNVKLNVTATGLLDRLLDNTKITVVLTHGFMESSDGIMAKALTSELLKRKNMDILVLDGRKFISYEYFRSTTYVRFIGEKLGSLLSEIIKKGQDANKIILIGHSLGAHVAGVAGKRIQQLTGTAIGRIIALDPAGPCFINVSRDNRLDRNDAVHVDVIHTNGGILGLKEPVGHKDFYPNGGSSQPGCFLSTCDHSRAWELFAESLTFPQHFIARRCSNWTMFREGHCSKNELAYMGINSTKGNHGSYFLVTNSVTPFGIGSDGTG
ncbi:PREDICTED: pancreatic lipase-related protein 3-like [Papilio polytes]|uniref:pancreatic lipase-related protein 3-like n=1 Tax=Papilio polytes TaxID=76194 RepID=UPI0006764554|nr:PREDICTED: pancreatic lipase-related protein 3-like [Papilio polytes]